MMNDLYKQAVEAFRAGNKGKAKLLLEQVVQSEPNNADALFGLAMCSDTFDLKRFYFEKVLAINPNYPKAKEMLDILLSKRPKGKIAIPNVDQASHVNNPSNVMSSVNIGYRKTSSKSWLEKYFLYLTISLIIIIVSVVLFFIKYSLTPPPIAAIPQSLLPTETEFIFPPTWTPAPLYSATPLPSDTPNPTFTPIPTATPISFFSNKAEFYAPAPGDLPNNLQIVNSGYDNAPDGQEYYQLKFDNLLPNEDINDDLYTVHYVVMIHSSEAKAKSRYDSFNDSFVATYNLWATSNPIDIPFSIQGVDESKMFLFTTNISRIPGIECIVVLRNKNLFDVMEMIVYNTINSPTNAIQKAHYYASFMVAKIK